MSSTLFGRYYKQLALSTRLDFVWIAALLLFELLLGVVIIHKVAYTEIDWIAYMQEVSGWYDDGEYDYRNLRGDTGPLVYPAGFLYLFLALRTAAAVSSGGKNGTTNIRTVQYIFLLFYIATQAVVLLIYQKVLDSKRQRHQQQQQQASSSSTTTTTCCCSLPTAHFIWSWRLLAMTCLCLSKRMHSIYMLRLFNDGPTMLLLYTAILLFMHQYWNCGCLIFSFAVSCKMNVLLFAPGLLLLLLQVGPDFWKSVILQRLGLCCALPQVLLGAPFLMRFPISYLRKAFELDRVFFYQWTVNFKFLPESVFVSKPWALGLLTCHLGTLTFYMTFRWLQQTAKCNMTMTMTTTTLETATTTIQQSSSSSSSSQKGPQVIFIQDKQLSPEYIAYTLMVSNFIGIVFARTLHYQFYSWYFHSLPLLMWCNQDMHCDDHKDDNDDSHQDTQGNNKQQHKSSAAAAASSSSSSSSYPVVIRILLLVVIESSFLTFPATATSSMLLQMAHFAILWQIQPPKHVFSIHPSKQQQQQQQQHESSRVSSKKQN